MSTVRNMVQTQGWQVCINLDHPEIVLGVFISLYYFILFWCFASWWRRQYLKVFGVLNLVWNVRIICDSFLSLKYYTVIQFPFLKSSYWNKWIWCKYCRGVHKDPVIVLFYLSKSFVSNAYVVRPTYKPANYEWLVWQHVSFAYK